MYTRHLLLPLLTLMACGRSEVDDTQLDLWMPIPPSGSEWLAEGCQWGTVHALDAGEHLSVQLPMDPDIEDGESVLEEYFDLGGDAKVFIAVPHEGSDPVLVDACWEGLVELEADVWQAVEGNASVTGEFLKEAENNVCGGTSWIWHVRVALQGIVLACEGQRETLEDLEFDVHFGDFPC